MPARELNPLSAQLNTPPAAVTDGNRHGWTGSAQRREIRRYDRGVDRQDSRRS
jgi:hypothetical protein